ncbi:HlyD family secretion protein [Methylocystis sp. ATCC 49242]|uniref:HlyD family secretion protein n=1 Tax=Methylocystis sp. ATCC 49242 TaxID=622637 RepID=UPI0001F87FD3|nr:HlyD family secretion protein [Methylocystis sp. ATCC 49242]
MQTPFARKSIRARRNLLLAGVGVVVALAGLFFGGKWLVKDRFFVSTDNAFVTGNLIPVYADATGIVSDVRVEETQSVKKGDVLMLLDRQRAEASLLQAAGDLARTTRNVGALFATRRQVCEKIASRAALRDRARHDLARYQQAATTGSVSQQQVQNTRDQLAALEADLRESRAELHAIEARVNGVTPATHPDVEAARAKYLDAHIEYVRQQVRAPASGFIAKRKAQVGQRVKPGDQLMTIVPLDHLWIEANLWENRLERVRPGQPVNIRVDLYGDSPRFHGTVDGIVPGSGSVFALLPPDNATGNFIRIVQRVPVRIALRPDEIEKHPLRPGLSTNITIDVTNIETQPNASKTKTASPEYATDVYSNDLAQGKATAASIVKENLPVAIETSECAAGN